MIEACIAEGPYGLWMIDFVGVETVSLPLRVGVITTHETHKGKMHYVAVRDEACKTIADAYLPLDAPRYEIEDAKQWLLDMVTLRSQE